MYRKDKVIKGRVLRSNKTLFFVFFFSFSSNSRWSLRFLGMTNLTLLPLLLAIPIWLFISLTVKRHTKISLAKTDGLNPSV